MYPPFSPPCPHRSAFVLTLYNKKSAGTVAYYPILRYRQTPTLQIIKQQPALYTDIVLVHNKEEYSRAQAFVVYYSRRVKIGDF